MSDARAHVHQLIDLLPPDQLAAVEGLLETIADPVARSLAQAPVDEEPLSAAEVAALDEAHASIERGEGIPHEEIQREFGLK